jgi:alcohol dehydrogenase
VSLPLVATASAVTVDGWQAELYAQRLRAGAGCLSSLGDEARALGASRVLIVSDPGIAGAGWVDQALASLVAVGASALVFTGICENPTEACVAAGAEVARRECVDLLVGLGGGSSMDGAKGINFVLAGGGTMEDYWGFGKAQGRLLPSIGVPCTAGTGSEAQSYALISRDRDHRKMACGDVGVRFRTVLLDPRLVRTAPAKVSALAGLDALSHAVEAYVTRTAQPVSRLFAREAAVLLSRSLPAVLEGAADDGIWSEMQLGAYWAGNAVESSMLGAAHALANPLTARYAIAHGEAVALLLPHVIRFNGSECSLSYAPLAAALDSGAIGRDAAEILAARVEDLRSRAGLAGRLREHGVSVEALPALVEEAAQQWTLGHNPTPLDHRQIEELYRSAL